MFSFKLIQYVYECVCDGELKVGVMEDMLMTLLPQKRVIENLANTSQY